MRMRMIYGLPSLEASIEHNAIPALGDALSHRNRMRLGHHLGQQAVCGGREAGQIRIVRLGNYQDMNRRLRIDVAKCKRALTFEHAGRRNVPGRDSAE
jgi:hypothetical protein